MNLTRFRLFFLIRAHFRKIKRGREKGREIEREREREE